MPKKAAPEEIELSEETYRSIVENSNDLIWVLDAEGNFIYANRLAEEVSGYALEELKGRSFAPLVHKEDLPRLQKLLQDSLKGREARFEVSFYAKNGNAVWLLVNATPLVEKRKIVGVVSFGQDVTEQRLTEEKLRKSEESLSEAQRVAHLGNWDWNPRTGGLYWSDENYKIFKIPRETKPSFEGFMRYVHPDDKEAVNKAVQDALSGKKPYDIDMRIIRGDGTEGVVNARAEVFLGKEGKPERMVGTVQDITERKQAEVALRRSEASLAQAQRIAHLGSWDWDLESDRARWSDEMCRIFGVESGGLRGLDESLRFIHPEDRDAVSKAVDDALKRNKPYSVECRIVRPDGSIRSIHTQGEVIFDGDGKPMRMLGTVQDITERKRAEEEIKKLNEGLEQKIKERTAQLEAANMHLADDLSERIKMDEEMKAEAGILDAASDSIFLHDAEGKFYYANEAAYRDRGYTKEELLAINLHQFDVPEYAKLIEPRIKELMEKGETEFESAHFRKDRSVMPVEVHLRLFDYRGKKLILSVARDITQRKKVEKALRDSEAMLREAQEVAHVGSWEHDLRTGEQHWSDELYRLLGRVPQGPKADFDTLMAAVHLDDREPLRKAIDGTISGRELVNGYFRIVWPNGSVRTVYARAEAVPDDSGKPARILGTVMDVTALRQTEAKSKEAEEKYRTIFENTRAAIAIIEEDTVISSVNPEFVAISGYPRDEIEGKKRWTEFVAKEDLERMKDYHRLRRINPDAAPKNYDFRFIDKPGNVRTALLTIEIIPGTKQSLASILDITERKKAEDKLKESEAKLREAQSTAHLGSWEWDTRTNGMQWSDEAYRILGLPTGSRATTDKFFDAIPIAERDVFRRLLDDAARTKKPISVDCHVVRSDGSVRTVHWNVVAAFDAQGSQVGMSGTVLDVTDLKQAEAKLKKYAEELEEKLGLLESRGVQRVEFLVKKGNSYLIREKHYENSTIVLYNLVKAGLRGVCVTAISPDVLKGIHGLGDADCSFVWLSAQGRGENVVSPADLEAAGARVSDFLEHNRNAFVHVAGLGAIVSANGFEKAYDFLNSLIYGVSKSDSRLVVAVNTEEMDAKQVGRIGELLTEITDDELKILGLKAPPKQ